MAFTKLLNDDKGKDHVPGARVVAAFKGGSADIPSSANRVEGFAKDLAEKWGVEIVDSIPALCAKVDVVLLESVDGRPHLEQARPVFAAKKRVFIDKPLTASLKDAREIARLSKESGTPFFSASSVRYYETMVKARDVAVVGPVTGAEAFAPSPIEATHPDLFWYGIHGVEALYSAMGPGCETVTRTHAQGTDVVVGRWKDGRIGTFRGIRAGKQTYGLTVFGEKAAQSSLALQGRNDYRALVVEIVKFFKTGEAPVSVDEMLEVLAFMEAADRSKAQGGAPVKLGE
jgi:predicted dehydrogenase